MLARRYVEPLKCMSKARKISSNPHRTPFHPIHETDSCGLPLKPTWSVKHLLESYPTPTVSPATFKRLHELSALVPLEQNTPEYDDMKKELEDLIKLVEAVRLVKFDDESGEVPDGRVMADGTGVPLTSMEGEGEGVVGTRLLQHAAHTADGFYLVDVNRKTK
jgi:hypothetical protein